MAKFALRFVLIIGIAWFAGSAIMGLLYQESIPVLIAFSVVFQLLALSILVLAAHQKRRALT